MISCKMVLANTNKDESVIISSKIRQSTIELSASMDRNLLLQFNDGIILVVHSQVLAYYSMRFFDNYRLNRYHVKITNDADIARNLIQFHYTGILQLLFFDMEKYFLIASQLAFDIALEALSQMLEKFSHQNSYHAIICANIACESNNHVATSCVKSIIHCAATFLKQSTNSDSYKIYASPNAAYHILQMLAIFADWKKSLQLALQWITYAECRYCYADFIFDAIVFKPSDELIRIVKEEIDHLPRKVGEILVKRCRHIIYRYSANASTSVRSSACNKVSASLIKTQEDTQSSSWSSKTENFLLPASSSTEIFDEFLLDDSTQRTHSPNSNIIISHEKMFERSQINSSQLLTMRNAKYSRESKISYKSRNEQNSRISCKLQDNYSKAVKQKITREKITSKEVTMTGSESQSNFEESLNQCALLSCFDKTAAHLPSPINIKHSREKEQSGMVRRQKITEQKIMNKMEYLNKFGFVADNKLSDNAITV